MRVRRLDLDGVPTPELERFLQVFYAEGMSPRRLAQMPKRVCASANMVTSSMGVGFSVGLAQLPATASLAQVMSAAIRYHNLWFLGTWLQATGSLLSVVFFLALVQRAGATTHQAGLLTILGATVLLSLVLVEGVFTVDLAQAAVDGHQIASLTSFDIMTVFISIYPIVPAPLIYLALGSVLPRIFGHLAIGLGIAFEIVGFVGLFTTSVLTLVVLSLQALWVLAAALAWLTHARMPATTGAN